MYRILEGMIEIFDYVTSIFTTMDPHEEKLIVDR